LLKPQSIALESQQAVQLLALLGCADGVVQRPQNQCEGGITVRSAGDQDSAGPIGVVDQSNARMRSPISPPPRRRRRGSASWFGIPLVSFTGVPRPYYHQVARSGGAAIILPFTGRKVCPSAFARGSWERKSSSSARLDPCPLDAGHVLAAQFAERPQGLGER